MEAGIVVKYLNDELFNHRINLFVDAGNKFSATIDKDFGEFKLYGEYMSPKDNNINKFAIKVVNKATGVVLYAYSREGLLFSADSKPDLTDEEIRWLKEVKSFIVYEKMKDDRDEERLSKIKAYDIENESELIAFLESDNGKVKKDIFG